MYLWLWGFLSLSYAARSSVSKQKFEMKKHLNKLNKPAVKSIQVEQIDDLLLFEYFFCLVLILISFII